QGCRFPRASIHVGRPDHLLWHSCFTSLFGAKKNASEQTKFRDVFVALTAVSVCFSKPTQDVLSSGKKIKQYTPADPKACISCLLPSPPCEFDMPATGHEQICVTSTNTFAPMHFAIQSSKGSGPKKHWIRGTTVARTLASRGSELNMAHRRKNERRTF